MDQRGLSGIEKMTKSVTTLMLEMAVPGPISLSVRWLLGKKLGGALFVQTGSVGRQISPSPETSPASGTQLRAYSTACPIIHRKQNTPK